MCLWRYQIEYEKLFSAWGSLFRKRFPHAQIQKDFSGRYDLSSSSIFALTLFLQGGFTLKLWLTIIFTGLLLSCQQTPTGNRVPTNLPSGVKYIESVAPKENEIVIPYQKYQLSNGLTVIIHEDQSDPLVHVDVTYHVGSAREELGKSGFAHFFEHMMFQGSEHVADEQHFKIISEAGGSMNGTTNTDRTNYFQTVPVNQLEKVLWLESDRMGFLLDAVTQKKFEVQRETVKNERGQRIDNVPYGRLSEVTAAALYPNGHPYSWPVIGFIDDLNRVNVNDLKAFFLRWYGPNNATLTVGGAVKAEEVLKLVKKYFGEIPRGPSVEDAKKVPVKLPKTRYVSMEDNIELPLVSINFPTVHAYHKDEAPLDVLIEIIAQGKTSILHKKMIETQKAVQVSGAHMCGELSCSFNLFALPNPRKSLSLADAEKDLRTALKDFEKRGVTDDDLIKIKSKIEANFIFGLQSVAGKVSRLAAYETFTNDPNYIQTILKRYRSVTKADVERVYNQYIKGKGSVVVSVVPKGQKNLVARADNYTPPKRKITQKSTTTASDLKLRVTPKSFDRSKIPGAKANPLVALPDLWEGKLDNGIELLGAKTTETPTTSLLIELPGGHYHTSVNKAGIASLTAALLNESTSKRSTAELSLALQKLGSSISISSDDIDTSIYISSLSKNLDATLDILMEKILAPGFKSNEFARLRNQTIQGIKAGFKSPGQLARRGWAKLMYGEHVAGVSNSGTLESVEKLTVADARKFYADFFKPAGGKLTIVSSLDKNDVLASLARLNQWKGKSKAKDVKLSRPIYKSDTVYIINKDKAAQAVIRVGKRSLSRDFTGDFFKAQLMNFTLGGAFNSRLNLNLREDKGYTYGARSAFLGDRIDGLFMAWADVRADVADKAFTEFKNEITRYNKQGMTAEEFGFMQKSYSQSDALKYETPSKKLSFLINIINYDLSHKFTKQQLNIIKRISRENLNKRAGTLLNFDSMAKLVVGDINTLGPKFKKLGYKVEELKVD